MSLEIPCCDVVVIGAGISGLTAATALSRAGKTVMVYEARDRVGGRAFTGTSADGAFDLGATWYWPNESAIAAVSAELGIAGFRQPIEGDALFERDAGRPLRLDGNPIDGPALRFSQGAQSLAEGLAARLPSGVLRLGDAVSGVELTDQGVIVTAKSGAIGASAAIIALPPALAAEKLAFKPALSPEELSITTGTAVWMGSTVKAVAVYEEAFWRSRELSGSAISYAGPFREFHDLSGPDDSTAALFAFANASAFEGLSSDQVRGLFTQQLIRLFGEEAAIISSIMITDWSHEQYSTPAAPSPEASTGMFGHEFYQTASAEGRLHWSSTETSPAFSGHMEGAILAGLRAARKAQQTGQASHACTMQGLNQG